MYIAKIKEIFSYGELLYYFAWRDLKVRYKQTVAGVIWVVLQPLALMTVFSVFLSQIGRLSDTGVPYPLYFFGGLIFWNLFSKVMGTVSSSVVSNAAVIKKIYFPRIIPALAAAVVASVDFLVTALLFLVLFAVFRTEIHLLGLLMFPVFMLILLSSALGLGLFFAALNVRFRDVSQALPFITQILFYMTPVIYPFSIVPDHLQKILLLNPATGVLIATRDAFFTGSISEPGALLLAAGMGVVFLTFGSWFFFKQEPTFVDTI